MSSIAIFLLVLLVIFWQPPFRLPSAIKNIFRPSYILVIISLLLLLIILDSNFRNISDRNQCISEQQQQKSIEKSFSF